MTTTSSPARACAGQPPHPPGYTAGRLHSDAQRPTVLCTSFDVKAYTQRARGHIEVPTEGVAVDTVAARDLAFLWRLESAAISETRAVLASWTANEARITAFIATWAVERHWMARALRDLLEASGTGLRPRGPRTLVSTARGLWVERALPIVAPLVGGVVKETVTAGHMARLAVQEGALQTAARALLPRLSGPAAEVVAEVARRRDDILAFYRAEALARATRSRAEAVSARIQLGGVWAPLRVVGVPDPDERAALSSIFARTDARRELAASDAAVTHALSGRPLPSVTQVARARAARSATAAPPRTARGL